LKILRFSHLFCGTDDANLSEINLPVLINCGQIFVEDFCELTCVTFYRNYFNILRTYMLSFKKILVTVRDKTTYRT